MKVIYKDRYLEQIAKEKPKGKPKYSEEVIKKYRLRIGSIISAKDTAELREIKSLHFERLAGNKSGLYSIRVDKRYRLEFSIDKEGTVLVEEIIVIEKMSNHYK